MKYIHYVFSECEGLVARTGGVARTSLILYGIQNIQDPVVSIILPHPSLFGGASQL